MQLLTMAILAAVSMGVSQETPTPKPEAPVAASEIKLKMLVKPTAAELTATLPARAANLTRPASVSLDCLITAAGSLEDCRVLNETPPGYGFGKAALLLSTRFRFETIDAQGNSVVGRRKLERITWAFAD